MLQGARGNNSLVHPRPANFREKKPIVKGEKSKKARKWEVKKVP